MIRLGLECSRSGMFSEQSSVRYKEDHKRLRWLESLPLQRGPTFTLWSILGWIQESERANTVNKQAIRYFVGPVYSRVYLARRPGALVL